MSFRSQTIVKVHHILFSFILFLYAFLFVCVLYFYFIFVFSLCFAGVRFKMY